MTTEQLTLFPITESGSMAVLEDDNVTTQDKIIDILRTLSDSFEDAMDKRADVAVFNWLMIYGLPVRPGDFRTYTHQITATMLGWAAANGYLTFTEKAIASDEEIKARPELPDSAFEEVPDEEAGQLIQGNFGQYL